MTLDEAKMHAKRFQRGQYPTFTAEAVENEVTPNRAYLRVSYPVAPDDERWYASYLTLEDWLKDYEAWKRKQRS